MSYTAAKGKTKTHGKAEQTQAFMEKNARSSSTKRNTNPLA